jgi:hypothetical protein
MSNFTQIRRFIAAGTLVVGLRKTLTHPTGEHGDNTFSLGGVHDVITLSCF